MRHILGLLALHLPDYNNRYTNSIRRHRAYIEVPVGLICDCVRWASATGGDFLFRVVVAVARRRDGFNLLHGSILDSSIGRDVPAFLTFITLLLWALKEDAHTPPVGFSSPLRRGQLITSPRDLESWWKSYIGKSTFHRKLQELAADGMVTLRTMPLGTLVTIVNYDQYNPHLAGAAEKVRGTLFGTPSGTPLRAGAAAASQGNSEENDASTNASDRELGTHVGTIRGPLLLDGSSKDPLDSALLQLGTIKNSVKTNPDLSCARTRVDPRAKSARADSYERKATMIAKRIRRALGEGLGDEAARNAISEPGWTLLLQQHRRGGWRAFGLWYQEQLQRGTTDSVLHAQMRDWLAAELEEIASSTGPPTPDTRSPTAHAETLGDAD